MIIRRLNYLWLLFFAFSACQTNDNIAPSREIKFMVFSDPHYFDTVLFSYPPNSYFQEYLNNDRKLLLHGPALLDVVIQNAILQKPRFVILPGDLTKDGELVSHQSLARQFRRLTDCGIAVYVIPGNHDINNPNSRSYPGATVQKTEAISPDQFVSVYSHCGYTQSIQRDSFSLSYLVEPTDGLWLLAIDAAVYSTSFQSAGRLSSSTLKWIDNIQRLARLRNKILIAMMHHGVVEHFSGQSTLFSDYLVSDWASIADSWASAGMGVVFTGHFHANDIVKRSYGANFIFDIQTGSIVSFPCSYRTVVLNLDSKIMSFSSTTATSIPVGFDFHETDFTKYAHQNLFSGIRALSGAILQGAPYYLSVSQISSNRIDSIFSNSFMAHYKGNEIPSVADRADIQSINRFSPVLGVVVNSLWTDLYPADDNISIDLKSGSVYNSSVYP